MNAEQILHFLRAADGSVPRLNNHLSFIMGYTRVPNTDPAIKKRATWFDPQGNVVTLIPDFTGSIDAARMFLEAVVQPKAAGFAQRSDGTFAQIDGYPPVKGATPALALCMAAIEATLAKA
ncbi:MULTISPECIES: hypothetical protein [unclassified Rhizobium]|uniref:hypothetical protein n=1 Tax=unclassified Rhizobium TaxID=2613769 RepID=UPI0012E3B044|nr:MULTISPECIES: hypothetical protein [unclassified Rhizobium]